MQSQKREKRHIIPLISMLMMIMFMMFVFSHNAQARGGEVFQNQDIKIIVPHGFSFLDKRQFTDAEGTANVAMFANLDEGDVFSVTTLTLKEKINDSSAIKVQIAQYARGVLDELKIQYNLSDVMKEVKNQKIKDKDVFVLNYQFQNDGVLTLYTMQDGQKIHFFSYLKVRDGKLSRGEQVTTTVVNSME